MSDKEHEQGDQKPEGTSRRSFLTGVGLGGAGLLGTGLALRRSGEHPTPQEMIAPRDSDTSEVALDINGVSVNVDVPDHRSLLLVLREDLGLTGTKKGCNLGECGACTVLRDGVPIYACLQLAKDAAGHKITTIEGLEKDGRPHPVQKAFMDHMGSQCGFCTPGMVMSGVALLRENPKPSLDEVRHATSGVICRCGNYPFEMRAIMAAAQGSSSDSRPLTGDAAGGAPVADIHRDSGSSKLTALQRNPHALDAHPKAMGKARYAGDLGFHPDDPFREPLYSKALRCPHPHASVVSFDDTLALALPGVRAIISYRDVRNYEMDNRTFLTEHCRFVGDAIAVVAADTQEIAQQALGLIKVRWNVLERHPDAEENLRTDLRDIHASGSVYGFGGAQPADVPTWETGDGDLEKGFAEAELIVEGRYRTGRQVTLPIEPRACTAVWRGDHLYLWDAQQSVFQARTMISMVLDIPEDRIHVYSEYIGGGFGGKCLDHTDNALYQLYAAFLARETKRPVRFEFTLSEELGAYESRHPFVFDAKWGVNRDGTIIAQQWKAVADTGGYGSSGAPVAMLAGDHIASSYRSANYHIEAYAVFTTNLVGGEFRGFGGLQGMYAVERHVDKVAHELNLDPLEFRLKNSKRTGDDLGHGVQLGVVDVEGTVRKAALRFGWNRWTPPSKKSGQIRTGLGMSQGPMPTGRAAADGLVWIDREGKVHVHLGVGNLGNAAHTGIAIVVEEVLGVPTEDQFVTWANTDRDAWTFCTDASRSCHCDGKAAYNAAQDCVRQLLELGARHFGVSADLLKVANAAVHRSDDGDSVDFQTLSRLATAREDFTPYWEPSDKSPLLDEQTGNLDEDPKMVVEASTEAAARKLIAESGGIVGLGRYVFNPKTKAWGACFSEVEVDMRTGQVKVVQLVVAHEVGRLLFPRGAEAQIHGGALQGMGFAMTEDLILDPHSSVPVNASYYEYRPPTSLDYPELVSMLLEAPAEAGPYGAKGLGESPIFGPPPAIGNAIFNATGVMIPDLPFTPDKVYSALRDAGKLMT